jgi:Na+/H+ antiporter NhaA
MITSRRHARSVFRDCLHEEAAGGIILMGAAALALIMANSTFANQYSVCSASASAHGIFITGSMTG